MVIHDFICCRIGIILSFLNFIFYHFLVNTFRMWLFV